MEPKDDKGSIPVFQLELLFLAAISTTGFSPQNSISDLEIAAAVINPIDTMKKMRMFASFIYKSVMPSTKKSVNKTIANNSLFRFSRRLSR